MLIYNILKCQIHLHHWPIMKNINIITLLATSLTFTSIISANPIPRQCQSIHILNGFQKNNSTHGFNFFAKALPGNQAEAILPGRDESTFASLIQSFESPPFKIFYSTNGAHAVNADYPLKVANALQKVWKEFSGIANLNMVDGIYPVYLENMDESYYGYVQPVSPIGDNPNTTVKEKRSAYSYMALRNSYPSKTYGDPTKALEVTIAHEFFHSVQTSRNAFEKTWLFEAQATAMESVIHPHYNDNHQYLGFWTQFPEVSITYESDFSGKDAWEGHEYGMWPIFYRGQDLYGWEFQKNLLEASVSAGTDSSQYGINTIKNALKKESSDLSTLMASAISAQIIWDRNIITSDSYKSQNQLKTLSIGFKSEADLTYRGTRKSWKTSNSLGNYGSALIKVKATQGFSMIASSFADIKFYLLTLIESNQVSSFSKITPASDGILLNRNSEEANLNTQYYVIAINSSSKPEDFSISLDAFDSVSPIQENTQDDFWRIQSGILFLSGIYTEGNMKITNSQGKIVWSGNRTNKIQLEDLSAGKYFWTNSLGHNIPLNLF
jgi:hypothetical protein